MDKPFPVMSYTDGGLDVLRLDAMLLLSRRENQGWRITRPLVGLEQH